MDNQTAVIEQSKVEITKPNQGNQQVSQKTKLDVVSECFERIVTLATEITEIKKMKTQGDILLQKMDKDRELLKTEAEAYAIRTTTQTQGVIDRMNVIRGMIQDFYAQSNHQISGQEFTAIITEIVNQMGRIDNGQQ